MYQRFGDTAYDFSTPPPKICHNPALFNIHVDDLSSTRHLGSFSSYSTAIPFSLIITWSYCTYSTFNSLSTSSCYPRCSNYTCLSTRIGPILPLPVLDLLLALLCLSSCFSVVFQPVSLNTSNSPPRPIFLLQYLPKWGSIQPSLLLKPH